MQHYGNTIFKSLVRAYNSLKDLKVVIRGLQPSSIFLSECATQVHFSDILSMLQDNNDDEHRIHSEAPYSSYDDLLRSRSIKSDRYLDTHSIAVILLEILVGTDLVLTCQSWQAVCVLIEDCREYLGDYTADLFDRMIRLVDDTGLDDYVEKFLTTNPEYISKTIRGMDYAVKDDRTLINKRDVTKRMIEREPATTM